MGKSFCCQNPAQIPSRRIPWHQAGSFLRAATSPMPSLLHPASEQSGPVQGAMCCPDLSPAWSTHGRVPDEQRVRAALLCDADIFASFQISLSCLPDSPGFPRGSISQPIAGVSGDITGTRAFSRPPAPWACSLRIPQCLLVDTQDWHCWGATVSSPLLTQIS